MLLQTVVCYFKSLPRLAISMAASAASAPLFPALVPLRSIACSIVLAVTSPYPAGIPDAMLNCASALETSALIYPGVRSCSLDNYTQRYYRVKTSSVHHFLYCER